MTAARAVRHGRAMPRKRDRRHDNPGRPPEGNTDVMHSVRVSAELDRRIRAAVGELEVSLSDWWRHAAEAGLKHPPKG